MKKEYSNQGSLNLNEWAVITIDDSIKNEKKQELKFELSDCYGKFKIKKNLLQKIIESTQDSEDVILQFNGYYNKEYKFMALTLTKKYLDSVLKKIKELDPFA